MLFKASATALPNSALSNLMIIPLAALNEGQLFLSSQVPLYVVHSHPSPPLNQKKASP